MSETSQEIESQPKTESTDEFRIVELFPCKHDLIETFHGHVHIESGMAFTRLSFDWKCSTCKKIFKLVDQSTNLNHSLSENK